MGNKTALNELRKPHPSQALIDSDSARLLQSTALRPGGHGAWSTTTALQDTQPWRKTEPAPLIRGK